ncbi:MAG: hypothetical protein PHO37_14980 [Kiritimatiellae bacterium]|jgi:hypothetical protein|nr:hypothetical protein [Kiritimatiellia bacterium]
MVEQNQPAIMNDLTFLGNNHKVIELIRAHYNDRGVLFSDNPIITDHKKILFFDPFDIDGNYLNYHSVYRRYLQLHNPEAKMVVLGLWLIDHPNYIDIFHLPDSLEDVFSRAKTAKEQCTLTLGGEDAGDTLKSFFSGHGDKSLMSSLINLVPALNTSHYEIVCNNEDWNYVFEKLIEPYSISGIEQFMQRWGNYHNIMEHMPFYPELLVVKDSIEDIGLHLKPTDESKTWFINSEVPSRLNRAVETLRQIESDYVGNKP